MRRKQLTVKITCKYCKFYHSPHTCTLLRKQVAANRCICNSFEKADTFWCEKHGYQIDTVACLNRQNKMYHGCVHCRQGKEIYKLISQRQLSLL